MTTKQLHMLGQSLWLDNITRQLLDSGTLERYCRELSLTGLTSNPTIFYQAMRDSNAYDGTIAQKSKEGKSPEDIFFELALEDLRRAAHIFRPVHDATGGKDGWASLEVSPLLINDAKATISQVAQLHELAGCKNLLIKIPGTTAGAQAIEESIFRGIDVNVTLLFSPEQYTVAFDAYCQGIARRMDAGLDPRVHCVASIFVSRWDKASAQVLPPALKNKLGIAVSEKIYQSHLSKLETTAWQTLSEAGALPQRVLWASTGPKDPALPPTYYVDALAAANTINTMPEKTLLAVEQHDAAPRPMPSDGASADRILAAIQDTGLDVAVMGEQLQEEGAQSFKQSWRDLLALIAEKSN
ncbi:transaldolase [Eoetvoesiella caeni]